ncbi:hypothetical protein QBA38_43725 [Streptomyces stelliscabiei]|uniref:hypothetical protein n=1 Tax=Streptomyces stelliscabiei TaxID=146820 RepID=UPI002FF2A1AD
MADAARDVLEHTARLGATISWDRLCEQVKGLAELTEVQQRQALKSASRPRSIPPLAALITTGDGTPHPHSPAPRGGERRADRRGVLTQGRGRRPRLLPAQPPGARRPAE